MLAVSNEQISDDDTHGTVTIVRDLDSDQPTTTFIPMDKQDKHGQTEWDDDYVLRKGLHMPLTKKSLGYWDELSHIAEDVDFKNVRDKYRSSIFIQGEALAWADEKLAARLRMIRCFMMGAVLRGDLRHSFNL